MSDDHSPNTPDHETVSGRGTAPGVGAEAPSGAPAPVVPGGESSPPQQRSSDADPVTTTGTDAPVPSDVAVEESIETGGKKKRKKKKKGTDLGTSRGIETMFRTSYRTHMDLSALADTKANIMISVNGLILTIILAGVSPKIDANHFLLFPTSAILITCLISMIYAILSARPRVTSYVVTLEDIRENRSNILFFGNFTKLSEEDFVTGMAEVLREVDSVYYHMIRDIYSLGGVLNRKFALLRVSYTVFMYGLVVSVVMFIGVYLYVVFVSPVPLTVTPFGTVPGT